MKTAIFCSAVSARGIQQVKAAVEAVSKLHGASLAAKNSKVQSESKLWARQLKGEGAMVKKWRLILRNLPFNVSCKICMSWEWQMPFSTLSCALLDQF